MKPLGAAFVIAVSITAAPAQQYVISTFAGGAPPPAPLDAKEFSIGTHLRSPFTGLRLATDSKNNIFFASPALNCVFRLDSHGTLTRVAGSSRAGYAGDGGPASEAQLAEPAGVALDPAGNLLIADKGNFRIRKVLPSGIIVTVAGTGLRGYFGDGGPAVAAQFGSPYIESGLGVAVDGSGNIFIGDPSNNRVRKVSSNGIITTIAGNGTQGFAGDGGPAGSAELSLPGCCSAGMAVDRAGNLYIADAGNNRVRKVSTDGIITTVAGNGKSGFSGDNGSATSASLSFPVAVTVDSSGNLFIVHYGAIRKVSLDGIITTVAGTGICCASSGDGGPATSAQVIASSVAVDDLGNVFIGDNGTRIRKISTAGIITTVAGNGLDFSSSGDAGPARGAQFVTPGAVVTDDSGSVFVVDGARVRKVSANGVISTVAGGGTTDDGDGGPATNANLNLLGCNSLCSGLAADHAGNLFLADTNSGRIRKIAPSGIITTVAGGGADSTGRQGQALSAALVAPSSVAVDTGGNVYISEIFNPGAGLGNDQADIGDSRVRQVSPDGTITTVAGGGSNRGDNIPATSTQLGGYAPVAVDNAGNLLIGAPNEQRIRRVSNGTIATVALGSQPIYSWSVAVNSSGDVFIADHNRIRKISPDGGMSTIAGSGEYGYYSHDGGPAVTAALGFISSIALDASGNIYASDWSNNAVHVLRPVKEPLLIGSVVDAASQLAGPLSPGKIVVIYGSGLGSVQLVGNPAKDGRIGAEAGGTRVSVGGLDAPVLYASATQVAAIVPYGVAGSTAQVTVSYRGQVSNTVDVPVAASAPSLFTANQSGSGQAAAINFPNTRNGASDPVKAGEYISLYATGEGQTVPAGVDGQVNASTLTHPMLPVSVTVDGIPALIQYSGGIPDQPAGLLQVNVQIPAGVTPGGYVPVVIKVGDAVSSPAVWIAVARN